MSVRRLVHEDCGTTLDAGGHCSRCGHIPDMQSTVLVDEPESHQARIGTLLDDLVRKAKQEEREAIAHFVEVKCAEFPFLFSERSVRNLAILIRERGLPCVKCGGTGVDQGKGTPCKYCIRTREQP